jgi:microcystin-dependent protein
VLSDANDVVIQTYDNLYGIVDAQPPAATPIPTGGILLWSGSIGSIPAGWVLCNGNNGTPDLRDRFIVGAGSTYAVDATGGSADSTLPTHTHGATSVVTDPGHVHDLTFNSNVVTEGTASIALGDDLRTTPLNGFIASAVTGITVATTNANAGVSATNGNLPPYYALCYIMKT